MSADPSIKCERRVIVKGWRGASHRTFTERHLFSGLQDLEVMRARIEENLPDWQPHITSVTVEERFVTPWREVDL